MCLLLHSLNSRIEQEVNKKHDLELETCINDIMKSVEQLQCALKRSVISLGDKVTDIVNTMVCCLYFYSQEMLCFS